MPNGAVSGRASPSSVDTHLLELIAGGARAASCELAVEAGQLVDRVRINEGVGAHIHGAYRDGRTIDGVGHLAAAAAAYLGEIRLDEIERPDPALLFWEAICRIDIFMPSPVWTPRPVPSHEPGARVVVIARDVRGLAGILYAHDDRARGFAGRVSHSSVAGGGPESRMRRAERLLGEDEFRSAAARGVAAHLAGDEGRRGADGGVPSLAWIVSVQEGQGAVRTVAASPTADVERRPTHRWGRLRDAALREIEATVAETVEPATLSLDTGWNDGDPFGSHLVAAGGSLERVELSDLLDVLTPRERAILELKVQGFTNSEIARHWRCKESTVRVHLMRARNKILETP